VRRVLPISAVIAAFLLCLTNSLATSAPPAEQKDQNNKAAILPPPPPIGGALFVVNSTGDGGNLGGTVCDDGTGNCTLRAAIEAANNAPGDNTVRFSIPTSDPGYDPSTGITTIPLTRALPDISTNISFVGPGPDKLTVTRGAPIPGYRIFRVTTSGTVGFSGLTIRNGAVGSAGGGFGGGIQNTNTGTVNIDRCIITTNHATVAGGGIDNSFTGVVNVSKSIISDNGASQGGTLGFGGGGIFNNRGTVTISGSTVLDI
jgi:CSLREA domain-containing protein